MQPGSLPACPDMTCQGSLKSYPRTSLTVFSAKVHLSGTILYLQRAQKQRSYECVIAAALKNCKVKRQLRKLDKRNTLL